MLPLAATSTSAPRKASHAPERRLRVLILDEELPYPANSGKRIRTLNLVTRLAQRHDITYLCHRNHDPAEVQPAVDHFTSCGIRPVVLDRAIPAKSGLAFYARLAWNLASKKPYSVQIHNSRPLRLALRRELAAAPVDLVQAEWTPYADCLAGIAGVPWIVMAHNIESLIWQRYRESEPGALRRWYIGCQHAKFARFEKHVFARADRLVTVSRPDAELARTQFAAPRVDVVDNGVDVDYFHPNAAVARQPGRLLFLGSLDWRPNLDAARQLLDHVFPQIRAKAPSAQLDIVDRNPPDWLRERSAALPGVEVHANVPDVRPFLWRSALMVVPLRIGGGSRLKILEALATGCPVVSTRVGAEGLHLVPDEHYTRADDVEDFAAAVLAVLAGRDAAQSAADSAREFVVERYAWDRLADRLSGIWQTLCHAARQL